MNRKQRIVSLLFIALIAISSSVFAHQGGAFVDDYKISPKVDFVPGVEFQQSWNITYGESSRPVQVLYKETKTGEEYIVRTSYFEVKYVNSDRGFGVKPLKLSEQQVPADLNMKVLNSNGLNNQKIISGNKVAREQVLEMIASYLPELINGEYQSILN
ncbi:MAG: hypothetical protein AB7U05_17475 [Mangrovibacterium sp.]